MSHERTAGETPVTVCRHKSSEKNIFRHENSTFWVYRFSIACFPLIYAGHIGFHQIMNVGLFGYRVTGDFIYPSILITSSCFTENENIVQIYIQKWYKNATVDVFYKCSAGMSGYLDGPRAKSSVHLFLLCCWTVLQNFKFHPVTERRWFRINCTHFLYFF